MFSLKWENNRQGDKVLHNMFSASCPEIKEGPNNNFNTLGTINTSLCG